MDLTKWDLSSAKLAVELQLRDIDELNKDMSKDGATSEQRKVNDIMKAELEKHLEVFKSKVLTLHLMREENATRVAFRRLMEEEVQAERDHQLAVSLSEMKIPESQGRTCTRKWLAGDLDSSDESTNFPAPPPYMSTPNISPSEVIRSSKQGKASGTADNELKKKILRKHAKTVIQTVKCNACLDEMPVKNTIQLDCKPDPHTYCQGCLIDQFKIAICETDLFPPQCCKVEISLQACRSMLPEQLVNDFELKAEEVATPNPTFCSNASCAKFIRIKHIEGDIGTCALCGSKTCAICKGGEHEGLCPEDPNVKMLMDTAKSSKYQQCSKCKNMVELAQGCFHMT